MPFQALDNHRSIVRRGRAMVAVWGLVTFRNEIPCVDRATLAEISQARLASLYAWNGRHVHEPTRRLLMLRLVQCRAGPGWVEPCRSVLITQRSRVQIPPPY